MKWSSHNAPALAVLSMVVISMCSTVSGTVAYVDKYGQPNTTLLLPALQDPAVQKIVLLSDYGLGTEFDAYVGHPLPINRNITITGLPGHLPVLDLQEIPGVLEICSSCTFTFQGLAIANETVYSIIQAVVSIIRGRTGSRVDVQDGIGLRVACLPTSASLAILNNTQRSSLWPRPDGRELADAANVTYKDKTYTNMLRAIDISSDMALQLVSDGAYVGGYAIRRRNMYRICDNIISADCVAHNSPEACVAQLTQQTAATAPTAAGGGPPGRIVAVVVPVVVGGVLVVAALLAILLLKRRTQIKQQAAQQEVLLITSKSVAAVAAAAVKLPADQDDGARREQHRPEAPAVVISPLQLQQQQQSGQPEQRNMLLGYQQSRPVSWEMMWNQTAPSMQWVDDDDMHIEFGPLLGAGSFARVFKARWAGLDVAVKVIQHDTSTAAAVANEVQIMMRLNHPNIVRAYHCVTRKLHQQLDLGSSRGHGEASGTSTTVATAAAAAAAAVVPTNTVGSGRTLLVTPQQVTPALPEITPLPYCSSIQQHQRKHEAGVPGASSVPSDDTQSRDQTSQLRIVVPVPQCSSDITPARPSVVTPGCSTGSSVSSGLLPINTRSGMLASTEGGSALSENAFRTVSSTSGHRNGGNWHLYVQNCEQPGSAKDSAVPPAQPLAIPQQQQQPGAQQTPSSADSSSSSSNSRLDAAAVQQASSAGSWVQATRLSIIYSGEYAASGSAAATAAGSGGGEQSEQQLTGIWDSPALETAGGPDSPDQVPAVAAAPPDAAPVVAAAAAQHRKRSSSESAAEVTPTPGASGGPHWPIIVDQSQAAAEGSAAAVLVAGREQTSPMQGDDDDADDQPIVACETWLVTEFCDMGTLARTAASWKPDESDQDMLQLLVLLLDVARGLSLLHAKNIVHADLNAHNILVSSSSTASFGLVAKIADLGTSRVIKRTATHRTTRTFGTLSHQPPELLRDGRTSPAVYIYSFGIMMWELYTGEAACARMRDGQIYHQVVICGGRPAVPPGMSDDYQLLMTNCWSNDPESRPSVDMILHCLELMIQDRRLNLSRHEGYGQLLGCC